MLVTNGPEPDAQKPSHLDLTGDLNDVYNDLGALMVDERTIVVPVYDADADPIYDDPEDHLDLHVKVNGRTATFWVKDECECCETRPQTSVKKDIGTQNPFRRAVLDFLQRVLNGTAPRKYNGGDEA